MMTSVRVNIPCYDNVTGLAKICVVNEITREQADIIIDFKDFTHYFLSICLCKTDY